MIRRRLCDSACPLDFSVLRQFKAEGGTDYVAIPMTRSDGEANAITFLTDRTGGFTNGEIAGLEYIAQALGVITESQGFPTHREELVEHDIGRLMVVTFSRAQSGVVAAKPSAP